MSTITKSRTSFLSVFKSLFSSGIDVEECEEISLPTELSDALKALSNKESNVEQAINVTNNSSKKGGFAKKINPNTEKAMRAMYNEVQRTVEDRERD